MTSNVLTGWILWSSNSWTVKYTSHKNSMKFIWNNLSLCPCRLLNKWGELHDCRLIRRSVCPLHSPHLTAAINLCQGIKLIGCWPYISFFKISATVRFKYFNNLFEVQTILFPFSGKRIPSNTWMPTLQILFKKKYGTDKEHQRYCLPASPNWGLWSTDEDRALCVSRTLPEVRRQGSGQAT